MKIPEWLPDTQRPTRPEGGSTKPIIDRLAEPFARFFKIEAAGGIVLLSCALIALGLANSPWAASFASLWQTKLGVTFGDLLIARNCFFNPVDFTAFRPSPLRSDCTRPTGRPGIEGGRSPINLTEVFGDGQSPGLPMVGTDQDAQFAGSHLVHAATSNGEGLG